MEIKIPYLFAMRERAPALLRQLRERGELDSHLQAKAEEAHRMYRELTSGLAKLPNGVVCDRAASAAIEEQIRAILIDF